MFWIDIKRQHYRCSLPNSKLFCKNAYLGLVALFWHDWHQPIRLTISYFSLRSSYLHKLGFCLCCKQNFISYDVEVLHVLSKYSTTARCSMTLMFILVLFSLAGIKTRHVSMVSNTIAKSNYLAISTHLWKSCWLPHIQLCTCINVHNTFT